MVRILSIFAVCALLALGIADAIKRRTEGRPTLFSEAEQETAGSFAPQPDPARGLGTRVVLRADSRGHYETDAIVSGRSVRFLVDTGATLVALDAETARRLNLRPDPRSPRGTVNTANGPVEVWGTTLPEVRIGAISVRNVEAAVMPPGTLDGNLLGMSFLKRLTRFEVTGNSLVLVR